jgi:RHS repeat-associated protein
MPTSYAFTGKHADTATGLDYYNARYYHPAAGRFTSADTALSGLDLYAYTGGNPITTIDPSGHESLPEEWQNYYGYHYNWDYDYSGGSSADIQAAADRNSSFFSCIDTGSCGGLLNDLTGWSSMQSDLHTLFDGSTSGGDKAWAFADFAFNLVMDATTLLDGAGSLGHLLEGGGEHALEGDGARVLEGDGVQSLPGDAGGCGGLSFSSDTLVATPTGEQAVGTLKVGDQVLAYDPQTGQTSTQTVEQTWINHDTDLLDVTLQVNTSSPDHEAQTATQSQAQDGQSSQSMASAKQDDQSKDSADKGSSTPSQAETKHEETIHTTANHPWLTADRGWVLAGSLRVGESVLRLDGTKAVVVAMQIIPGSGTMDDLSLGAIHTFAVGVGQYVVHNTDCRQTAKDLHQELYNSVQDRYLKGGRPGTYGQFTRTTSVGVADMEKDGEQFWVASLSGGGKAFADDLKVLVEGKGGRFIDPRQFSWWGDAEDYIGRWAQINGASPIKIGSGKADMGQVRIFL